MQIAQNEQSEKLADRLQESERKLTATRADISPAIYGNVNESPPKIQIENKNNESPIKPLLINADHEDDPQLTDRPAATE